MGSSLAGLLILAVLLTASLMIWRVTLAGNVVIHSATKSAIQLEGEQARTVPSITTAKGDRNNNTLTVTVKNDGATSVPLSDFDKMDVVVFYDSAAQPPVRLTYTTTNPPPDGQWTKTAISGTFEPDVWNPVENLTILADLVGATCAPGTVTTGFPNGIIDTSPFICAGLDLTFHSEVTTIDGDNYYTLKNETPADGAATTISSVFAPGVAGRVSPPLTANNGEFVFPLTGITQIPAATWNITYRIKRDKADMGFVWFTNAYDISIDAVTGTHDGAMNAASLTDLTATIDFKVEGVMVGDTILNTTDGSSATVTAITTTTNPNDTLVGALSGGTDDDWDTGDSYSRNAPLSVWRPIDLSPFVPVGATGALVDLVNSGTTADLSGVVRGTEDTRNYMANVLHKDFESEAHRWQIVKVDSNLLIEGYVEHTDIDFKLLGYTVGSDPSYIISSALTPEITPGTFDAWTTVDVSNYVATDADGVILYVESTKAGNHEDYAFREVGSTFDKTNRGLKDYSATLYVVGLNANYQFEAFVDKDDTVNVYLVGQTKGSVGYYSLDTPVADTPDNTWTELDADAYVTPSGASGLFLRVVSEDKHEDGRKILWRHPDSLATNDWNGDIYGDEHYMGITGLRTSDNIWDQYMEKNKLDVTIAGYTRLIKLDVHAEIDVVIRDDATGAVIATLASDKAQTTLTIGTEWQTMTVGFPVLAYTVADPNDYLEIDLFVEAASPNLSGESVSVDFRIDDPTLAVADQMRAWEVVP